MQQITPNAAQYSNSSFQMKDILEPEQAERKTEVKTGNSDPKSQEASAENSEVV